jgi:hypothetical protein
MATETPIRIHDVRLSFIWVKTFLDLLKAPQLPALPLSFLGRRSTYAHEFERALAGQPVPGDLTPPWPKTGKHFFWTYYLKRRSPHHLSGNKAWSALVPLRGPVPATVALPDEGWRLTAESFVYPCGIGLVISATYRGDAALFELVKAASALAKKRRQLHVEWHTPGSPQVPPKLNLGKFADAALDRLRRAAWRPQSERNRRDTAEPFTVATVVHGSGVDPEEAVAQDEDVHRALEALTSWKDIDQGVVLPDLSNPDVNLPKSCTSKGGVLYARTRGRAVWFPGLFRLAPDTKLHSLGCYHRNLVLVSLQVESLAGLMLRVTEHLEDLTLSEPLADCARHAAIILGQLYKGAPSTYRSYSPRAQIEQNKAWLEAINAVRDYFNLAPLA